MRLGSFEKYTWIGEQIRREREAFPLRRQVASVLLVSADGKRLCLVMSKAAQTDGRYNMTTPQGGVEPGESVYDAAARELYEEMLVQVSPADVVYLGSVLRPLPEGHKHRDRYLEAHYHLTAVHARTNKLVPQPPLTVASWHHLADMRSQAQLHMSEEKKAITLMGLKALRDHVGDPFLVRRELLTGDGTIAV